MRETKLDFLMRYFRGHIKQYLELDMIEWIASGGKDPNGTTWYVSFQNPRTGAIIDIDDIYVEEPRCAEPMQWSQLKIR